MRRVSLLALLWVASFLLPVQAAAAVLAAGAVPNSITASVGVGPCGNAPGGPGPLMPQG